MTVDERFDRLESLLDKRFVQIDARLSQIDARLDKMDARFDGVDARFDRIDDYVLKFRSEVIQRFETVDRRLDFLMGAFSRIESQLPAINKSVGDFGMLAGQLARERMEASGHEFDILNRIAKLEEKISKLSPAA